MEKIKNRLFEGSASGGDGRVSKGQSAGRREQEFATLEMKALNEKQRADLATSRLRSSCTVPFCFALFLFVCLFVFCLLMLIL